MRNHFFYITFLCIIIGCNTENASDCFKTSGKIITKNYSLDNFSTITFREGIALELIHGNENTITISYGSNLINNVSTRITDGRLFIENSTYCNHIRNVTPAKITLTAKNITEIRNASQFKLYSNDTIRYESLLIISENFLEKEANSGDVDLLINNQNLSIITNGTSNFNLNGKTTNLSINFAAGSGKFNGKNLLSENIYVFHRGSNDLIIHPIRTLKGEIRSIGNLISVNRPPIVDIKQLYTGKLIFRE